MFNSQSNKTDFLVEVDVIQTVL